MDKIIELAKKLKALTERGEGGEKINAHRMLRDLMNKHDISLDQIEEVSREKRQFTFKANQQKLFTQIAAMVMGRAVEFWRIKGKRNVLLIECTVAEFLEIQAAFDFFWEAYERELKVFDKAFIYRNNLLPKDVIVTDEPMDQEELGKLTSMMRGIDRRIMQKRLSVGANMP